MNSLSMEFEILACWFAIFFGVISSYFSYRSGDMLFSVLFSLIVIGAIIELVYLGVKHRREK